MGNNFDPSLIRARTFVNIYTYSDANGFTNSDNTSITVNPLPVVTISPVAAMCISASAVTLNGTPVGGTFSGTGVVGNNFDPSRSEERRVGKKCRSRGAQDHSKKNNTSVTVNPL